MKKKSYIIFPILGIVWIIFNSYSTYSHQTNTNSMILEKFDMTGMTSKFLIIMGIINIAIFIFGIYMAKKAENDGYNYKLNKIFAIIFLILAIASYLSFVGIRQQEEKIAQKLDDEIEELYGKTININNKKTKNKINQISKQQETDKFYTRKLQIITQMKNGTKVDRYVYLFMYWPFYNKQTDSINTYIIPSEENSYYGIFSSFALIDLIAFGFYFMHIRDEYTNSQSQVLEKI